MSNLGLERYLGGLGLELRRTRVGDRYVVEPMRSDGCNLGGEQSGHIVLSDFATTGDGLLAALQVLAVLRQRERPASEVTSVFEPVPQQLRNVRTQRRLDLAAPAIQGLLDRQEARLTGGGSAPGPRVGNRARDPGDGRGAWTRRCWRTCSTPSARA